ncbi:hypothetical protein IWQ60_008842 [Tieghemiomyces parasiticus]|uniref:phospholipase D n=1 Tax=Tieghemiomyces parasiticus TaxID=78921 RepID=A0A9W7ZW08_9FUNG|nr:hypothetical protein IWQ60_008842 [Tieghemiomyces parasiticus]
MATPQAPVALPHQGREDYPRRPGTGYELQAMPMGAEKPPYSIPTTAQSADTLTPGHNDGPAFVAPLKNESDMVAQPRQSAKKSSFADLANFWRGGRRTRHHPSSPELSQTAPRAIPDPSPLQHAPTSISQQMDATETASGAATPSTPTGRGTQRHHRKQGRHRQPGTTWSSTLARLRERENTGRSQGDGPSSSTEEGAANSGEVNPNRARLRQSLQRAVRKANAFRVSTRRRRDGHLKSVNNQNTAFPLLGSAMIVPIYFLQRDEHGWKPPPIIWEAMRLSVTDSDVEQEQQTHFTFRIELEYGDVKWVVYRRFSEFLRLHYLLTLRYYQGKIPELPSLPSQVNYAFEAAKIYHNDQERTRRRRDAAQGRRAALENYLLSLLKVMNMRVSYELCAFLELSAVSITKDLGWKGKEGFLDQKVQRLIKDGCFAMCQRSRWRSKWLLVRDSFVAVCDTLGDTSPSDVFLADPSFEVRQYHTPLGHNPLHPYRLSLLNSKRRIELRGESAKQMNEWYESLQHIKLNSPWAQPHRFESFAPIRENTHATWYVDGQQYFFALSEALRHAKETIFIEDWWLSPDIYLRRPPAENEEFRLDRLLYRKAEEGVVIYIVVYKEVTVSLPLNSLWTKKALRTLHPNIHVQRHPDHLPGGTFYWAHHEKIVVIDSNVAFIGGLDLCYGRYDTHAHRLADYTPQVPRPDGRGNECIRPLMFPGQDFNNARIKDFANVERDFFPLIPRERSPRMPWHDVHMGMVGPAARDVARHFIERWNFIKSSKAQQRSSLPYLMPKGEYVSTRADFDFRGTCRTQILRSSAQWSMGIQRERSIFTAYADLISTAQHFVYIENQFFITSAKDDPSHEVKNLVGKALVDRIARAHHEGTKFRAIIIIPLMPAFAGDINAGNAATLRLVVSWQYQSISRGAHSIMGQLRAQGVPNPEEYISFYSLRNYDVINWRPNAGLTRCANDVAAALPTSPNPAASSKPSAPSPTEGSNGPASLDPQVMPTVTGDEPAENPSGGHGKGDPGLAGGNGSGAAGVSVGRNPVKLGGEAANEVMKAGNVPPNREKPTPRQKSGKVPANSRKSPEYPPTSLPDAEIFEMMRRERSKQIRHAEFLAWQREEAEAGSVGEDPDGEHPHHQPRRTKPSIGEILKPRTLDPAWVEKVLPSNPPILAAPPPEKQRAPLRLDNFDLELPVNDANIDEKRQVEYLRHMADQPLLATRARVLDDLPEAPDAHLVARPSDYPRARNTNREPDAVDLQSASGGGGDLTDDEETRHLRSSVTERATGGHRHHLHQPHHLPHARNFRHPRYGRNAAGTAGPGLTSDSDNDSFVSARDSYSTSSSSSSASSSDEAREEADSTDEINEVDASHRRSRRNHPPRYRQNSKDPRRINRRSSSFGSDSPARAWLPGRLADHAEQLFRPPRSKDRTDARRRNYSRPELQDLDHYPTQSSRPLGTPPNGRAEADIGPTEAEPEVAEPPSPGAELEALRRKFPIEDPNLVTSHVSFEEMMFMREKWLAENPDTDLTEQDIFGNIEMLKQIVTEQVYIHCKLLIVDDRRVIMGSANINDRSMLGDHDSEIAILVEDQAQVETTMDGKPYQAAKFAHTLRTYLCKEHLGLLSGTDMDAIHKEELEIIERYLQKEVPAAASPSSPDPAQRLSAASSTGGSANSPPSVDHLSDSSLPNQRSREKQPATGADEYVGGHAEVTGDTVDAAPGSSGWSPDRLGGDSHQIGSSRSRRGSHAQSTASTNATAAQLTDGKPNALHIPGATEQLDSDTKRSHDDLVADPLSDHFFRENWVATARQNTQTYRDVFKCVPDDTIANWAAYKGFVPNHVLAGHAIMDGRSHEEVMDKLKAVKGHLVVFPLNFLQEENLSAASMSAEYVVPLKVFI